MCEFFSQYLRKSNFLLSIVFGILIIHGTLARWPLKLIFLNFSYFYGVRATIQGVTAVVSKICLIIPTPYLQLVCLAMNYGSFYGMELSSEVQLFLILTIYLSSIAQFISLSKLHFFVNQFGQNGQPGVNFQYEICLIEAS